MAKPIEFGQWLFPSKKIATEAVRELANNAEIDTPLDGLNHEFLLALIGNHPHVAEKIGAGIQHFVVRENRFIGRKTRGFWIKRVDGSEVDFSWVECLTPSSHRQRVLNALRAEVQDDVFAFKQEAFRGRSVAPCWLSGGWTTFDEADVHHETPFLEIVDSLLHGDFDSIHVTTGASEGQIGDRLTDRDFADLWRDYHHKRATLHIVHRRAHQSLPKGSAN